MTSEGFPPKDHPLRRVKLVVDSGLVRMSPLFNEIYASDGLPSTPPEHLLKSSLLMAFCRVHSEQEFGEQLRYNLLFKRFLDLAYEDEPSVRSRSRRITTGSWKPSWRGFRSRACERTE